MSKFLINVQEVYRVDSEQEAKKLIEEAKNDNKFQLVRYVSEFKEKKVKGEVVDQYYKVTLNKSFNDIKEPNCEISVKYENELYLTSKNQTIEKKEEEEETPW